MRVAWLKHVACYSAATTGCRSASINRAMTRLTLRIDRKQREADDIYSFDLVAPGGEALPPFEAGSHIDVRVADGLVRQYSLYDKVGAGP